MAAMPQGKSLADLVEDSIGNVQDLVRSETPAEIERHIPQERADLASNLGQSSKGPRPRWTGGCIFRRVR